MSHATKCDNCGVYIDNNDDVYVIGKKFFDQIELCWDCFLLTLNLGDVTVLGWMGLKNHIITIIKQIRRLGG